MKFLLKTALCISVFICRTLSCDAQYAVSPSGTISFDRSIAVLRDNAADGFSCTADDWLQYSPAAVMLGLKVCGYEGRSSWGRMLVSDAFSAAVMVSAVYGLKSVVSRQRPDGTSWDSFPSGHAAKSFMAAAMLHEEYGWRSPWFSLGGYAAASVTGILRIVNDRHWTSDVVAGAVIGMASVKLGYWLADLIFRDRYVSGGFAAPEFGFDAGRKYYDAGLYFGYRFFLGDNVVSSGDGGVNGILERGGTSGLEISLPLSNARKIMGTAGLAFRIGANSYCAGEDLTFNTYDFMTGGYWRRPFARVLEVDTRLLAGYSMPGNRDVSGPAGILGGLAAAADCGLAVTVGENFKIKAFASYEVSRFTVQKPFVQSAVLGGSAAFFW